MPKAPKTNKQLSYMKCQRCRLDKAKLMTGLQCLPLGRVWPGPRCVRCERFDYPCSKNCTRAEEASTSSPNQDVSNLKSLPEKRTDNQLLTDLSDIAWLAECSTALDEYDNDEDWEISNCSLLALEEEAADQASLHTEKSLYLLQCLRSIRSPAVQKSSDTSNMNYYGSRLSYENSKELATLHERNGNYYEAERVLSEVLMFSADEFFYYDCEESVVNQLLRLYHRFLQRILTTKLEGFSKAAAQKTILNLVARIDDHRLTSALYWEPWVGLEVFHSNALFFAAKYDACNLARFALDRGVDIERTYRDRTALHFALEFQSSRVVKLLVAKGASIEVVDDWGETPLLKAVMSKSLDQVALLISRGASLEAQGSSCWTPLMQASLNGSLEIVRMLLENGAKVNATVKSGETALYLAAEKRHFGTLRLLLTFNADILVRGFSGKTVLHAAALRRDCNDSNAVDCVHALVDSGLDVDAYNDVGETPLHLASFQCSHRLVAYLLKKGASPLAKAYRGTALHFAVDNEMRYQKDSEMLLVVASLFAYGAIANESRPLDGKTPLHLAAQFTREYDDWYGLKVLQLLLRYGGDMDRLDSSQLSPIDYLRQANPDAVCLRVYLPEYESEISNSGISLPTA